MKKLSEQLSSLQNKTEKQQCTKGEVHGIVFKNKRTGSKTRHKRKTFKKIYTWTKGKTKRKRWHSAVHFIKCFRFWMRSPQGFIPILPDLSRRILPLSLALLADKLIYSLFDILANITVFCVGSHVRKSTQSRWKEHQLYHTNKIIGNILFILDIQSYSKLTNGLWFSLIWNMNTIPLFKFFHKTSSCFKRKFNFYDFLREFPKSITNSANIRKWAASQFVSYNFGTEQITYVLLAGGILSGVKFSKSYVVLHESLKNVVAPFSGESVSLTEPW